MSYTFERKTVDRWHVYRISHIRTQISDYELKKKEKI